MALSGQCRCLDANTADMHDTAGVRAFAPVESACKDTHRLGDIEARENIPGGNEGSQDGGGDLKVGGHIYAHDAHVGEVVQGQQQKEQEPEEFACA